MVKRTTARAVSHRSASPTRSAAVLQLKVTQSDLLARVRGYPYRVIEILGRQTLAELAEAILDSFDFEHDHLYGFYDNLKNWPASAEKYEWFEDDDLVTDSWFKHDALSVRDTKVSNVFREPKQKMLFLYDYGAEHRFIVQFLRAVPDDGESIFPLVIEAVGDPWPQYPDWDEEDVDSGVQG
ncbi:IS1096 element passenger TnpR family protein [Alicyclobacillus macrosporangiidus]|uniref:PRiA4b ORF-3-like protein n=1 Tax=Alicyclobacillus macrosporangiidus TaxID=392015 RepID=A0A1I7G6G0_9BACL|nr:hypothetical protein [Alicyclobacillus macrosporangiidus]SFU44029.1 pRiA4b ORF-3-like protein [Alicyclobacillus macrosporangiidus]